MYKELTFYNTNTEKDELVKEAFTAIESKINGLSVHPYFLSSLAKYIPNNFVLACPVDYPLGCSDTKVRQHNTISNINLGANTIDLMINNVYLVNSTKTFKQDLAAIKKICDDKGVLLRTYYEYRQNFQAKHFSTLKSTLVDLDISHVFPSSGLYVDNYADNLIVAKALMIDTDLNVICSANIFTKEQYDIVEDSNIFGIRFSTLKAFLNCTKQTATK